jgi:radical SAM protein with 4Fe4S-binding SPASM domain
MKYQLNRIKINYEPFLKAYLVVYPKKDNAIRILPKNSIEVLKLIDKGLDLDDIITKISTQYNLNKKQIKKDLLIFLNKLLAIDALKVRTQDAKPVLSKISKGEKLNHLFRPLKVHIAITNKCNLKCKHCYNLGCGGELSKDKWFKVIDYLSDWGVLKLQISGGEPLCHPNFKEIISYASKKNFSLMLFTNGTLIQDSSMAQFIKDNFSTVQINLDGPREYHDVFRGVAGSFNKTNRGIDLLLKEGVNLILGMSIDGNNKDMMEEVYSFALKKGIKNVRFSPIALEGRGVSYQFSIENYKEIWKHINKFIKSKEKDKNIKILQPRKNKLNLPRSYNLCSAGKTLLHISANGDIFACPLLTFKELKVGNFFKKDLKKIWNNAPHFKQLRNIKFSKCEKCSKDCAYWCRGINYGLTKKLNTFPEFCLE